MITLVTVNYNNAEATIGLMKSLEAQTDRGFDVFIVDNDSSPDDRGTLGGYASASQLNLEVIYSERNRGFAGGNNLAIRKALEQGSDWIVLVNNDTTVGPEFVADLKAQLSEPAVVAIPLKEGERTAFAGLTRWLRTTLPHDYSPVRISSGHYAIGAGLAVHRDVLAGTMMDERYFLYFEDADFSEQARRHGAEQIWLARPVVTHRVSESTRRLGSPSLLYYHTRNALRFNLRNGPFWVLMVLPFWSAWIIMKQLAKLVLRSSEKAAALAIMTGIKDFYAGKTGPRTE